MSAMQFLIGIFLGYRPSTFAQAAKLRRLAAAKEKELANCKSVCCCNPFYLNKFLLHVFE